MVSKVVFSSKKHDWETPSYLFNKYNDIYNFELDVCAEAHNTKLDNYISPEQNGLKTSWADRNWCNPPYRNVSEWVEKAYKESWEDRLTVMLLPARTDTKWFHRYIYKRDNVEVEFLKGRLKFVGAQHAAPFPSMIVIFKPISLDFGY